MTPKEARAALDARRAKIGARKVLAPRPIAPRALELQYDRALTTLNDELVAEVKRFLAPSLAAEKARQDADDLAELRWGVLRARLGRITDAARALVDAHGARLAAFSAADIGRILKIDLAKEPPGVRKLLAKWRRENVDLIESIGERLHDDVYTVVTEATRKGVRVESLARRLAERYDVSKSRARLIARDQTMKANADLTRQRHTEAGITRYVWSTSRDERVREMHAELEGRVFAWDDPPVTNERGDRNHPGEDISCRCIAIPVLSPDPDE